MYTLVVGAVVYLGLVKLSTSLSPGKLLSAAAVTLLPLAFVLVQRYIYISGFDLPLTGNLLTWTDVVVSTVQFIAAVYIFHKIEQTDAGYTAWLGWVVAGLIVIVAAIPVLLRSLFHI